MMSGSGSPNFDSRDMLKQKWYSYNIPNLF